MRTTAGRAGRSSSTKQAATADHANHPGPSSSAGRYATAASAHRAEPRERTPERDNVLRSTVTVTAPAANALTATARRATTSVEGASGVTQATRPERTSPTRDRQAQGAEQEQRDRQRLQPARHRSPRPPGGGAPVPRRIRGEGGGRTPDTVSRSDRGPGGLTRAGPRVHPRVPAAPGGASPGPQLRAHDAHDGHGQAGVREVDETHVAPLGREPGTPVGQDVPVPPGGCAAAWSAPPGNVCGSRCGWSSTCSACHAADPAP